MDSPVTFGPFTADLACGALFHRGRRVPIQRKPFELLAVLLEHAGRLVTREELYERLWPDGTHVDFEHGLNTAVRKLRRALGEAIGEPHHLETVAGRGYCLHVAGVGAQSAARCVLALWTDGEATSEFGRAVRLWRGETMPPAASTHLAWFPSPDHALRCGVGLIQRARVATSSRWRAGIASGHAAREEALLLCAAADPGQTAAAAALVGSLPSHEGLVVRDHPPVRGAGVTRAVVGVEASVLPPAELLARPPFVGRQAERSWLAKRLDDLAAGTGGIVVIAGEPGIGKTRLIEECSADARLAGVTVLAGRCLEDDLGRSPLCDALDPYLRETGSAQLRATLPLDAASVVAGILPALPERLGDLPVPPALRADEDRVRRLDALTRVFVAIAASNPVLLVLDDLQWADPFTYSALPRLAHAGAQAPLLVLVSHRDVPGTAGSWPSPVDAGRLPDHASLTLTGLEVGEVHDWLEIVVPGFSSEATIEGVRRASGGNPFFIRELLLEWAGRSRAAACQGEGGPPLDALGLTTRALDLVGRRLATLSEPARRLLMAGASSGRVFRFQVAARAAGLSEDLALDALDECYEARLVRAVDGHAEDSEFFHAVIREAVYARIPPARRIRLHRRIAEELRLAGASAAAVARQFHESRGLAGAEPGAELALEAATQCEGAGEFESAARWLRVALDLLPAQEPRRARISHRLAIVLGWSGAGAEAAELAERAAHAIAASDGAREAAVALAAAADAIWLRSFRPFAEAIVEQGLEHLREARDEVWLRLAAHRVLHREAMDPEMRGLPADTALRREVSEQLLERRSGVPPRIEGDVLLFDSRDDALARAAHMPGVRAIWIGDYRGALPLYREQVREALSRGQIALAADRCIAICHAEIALGNLAAADEAAAQVAELVARAEPGAYLVGAVPVLALMRARLRGHGVDEALGALGPIRSRNLSFKARQQSAIRGAAAAWLGRSQQALDLLDVALPAIERGPGWAAHQTSTIGNAAEILWRLPAQRHRETLERNLVEKTLVPDFRAPDTDARLSMARLCALAGRHEEAREWFARARRVLEEQGARPLRAIADLDEATMDLRRDLRRDRDRVQRRLDEAVSQFESIGMWGWIERARAAAG